MKKVLVYLCLILWSIWTLTGIIQNANHYSLLDWIIVIIVYFIPCSVLILLYKLTSKQHKKDKPQKLANAAEITLPHDNEQAHDLLAWQNLLYPGSTKLRFNEKQLKSQSAFVIKQQSEAAHDCMELINNTSVPSTFFSRYDLLIEKLTLLSKYEKYVKFNTYSPTQQLNSAIIKKSPATNTFIDRYWNSTVKKANSSKTGRDRKNHYQIFYDTLLKYTDKMTEENILHIENIVRDKIDIERPNRTILDAQTSNLQNILINILTKSVKRKMGGGVAFETSDDEDKFFRKLILNALENNLEPKNFYFEPMSNKSFSIHYQDFPIGRIKLHGRKTYMQIINEPFGVNKLYDLSLDEYMTHIPEWIKYIEHCIDLKEQCLTP